MRSSARSKRVCLLPGLPLDVGAALLIELDGIEAGIDDEAERVRRVCLQYGARSCRSARDENERKKLWAARKGAFGAIGRISPDSMIQDAVVPRSRLPEVLDAAYRIAAKYQLRIANVFHAGDGNLHPLICFDSRSAVEVHNVKEAGRELMETCVRAGGSITGEHGVGLDKRELLSLIFSPADLDVMLGVRAAFDPTGLCNPGKIIPMLRGCGEARATKSNVQSPMSNVLLRSQEVRPGMLVAGAPQQSSTNLSLSDNRTRSKFDPNHAQRQFSGIVGESNIQARDSSSTSLVVHPGSINEVCEVMKLASSEGWAVVPAGAMTWLDAGQPLQNANIIVSTERLNRMIEHEPADLVAITEAGVTLNGFNAALSQKGQWLAIDPPDDGRATVGGVIATGLAGAQQYGYGPPRRHVIGMKVVMADGRLIKAGGRVVKNVAGYDLCKLFTGSYGSLGIIVEVNFKLRPLPSETITVVARGSRHDLLTGARHIIAAPLFPVAVELLSPALAKANNWSDNSDHLLFVRFAGSASAVKQQANAARALLGAEQNQLPEQVETDDSGIWRSVAAVPLHPANVLVWRAGLRPGDLELFINQLSAGNGRESMWHAGVGDGRVRVVERSRQTDNDSDKFQDETIARLRELANTCEERRRFTYH